MTEDGDKKKGTHEGCLDFLNIPRYAPGVKSIHRDLSGGFIREMSGQGYPQELPSGMYPRAYADFNNRDVDWNVRLNTTGFLADLARLPPIVAGMYLTVSDGEVEVAVQVGWDGRIWIGVPISDYRYLDEPTDVPGS